VVQRDCELSIMGKLVMTVLRHLPRTKAAFVYLFLEFNLQNYAATFATCRYLQIPNNDSVYKAKAHRLSLIWYIQIEFRPYAHHHSHPELEAVNIGLSLNKHETY
jgi:hypothetical protein